MAHQRPHLFRAESETRDLTGKLEVSTETLKVSTKYDPCISSGTTAYLFLSWAPSRTSEPFSLASADASACRGKARRRRGVATHGEWSQHKGAQSASGSDSVRKPPSTTTSADRRWPKGDTDIPPSALSLGRFPLSLGSRPSSLRRLSLEAAGTLRQYTRGERSDQVPSGGLLGPARGELQWILGVVRGHQQITPLAP